MILIISIVAVLFAAVLLALIFSALQIRAIGRRYQNVGTLTDIGGYRMNAIHIAATDASDLPPLVFIHGASGNLRDQFHAFAEPLKGRAEMLFVDRPGHGFSERGGKENALPSGQADAIARLMDAYGMKSAIIVGHSFGGAIAAAFGVRHPEKTGGLLFLAPATHPWPGGVDWYYNLSIVPLIGWLFTRTLVLPIGLRRIESGTINVFHPNPRPPHYIEQTAPELILRPGMFQCNAEDVVALCDYLKAETRNYRTIKAPTVIITGDSDTIVWEHLHSRGLQRDIEGAEYIKIAGLGHKPDYCVTDLAIAAMEKIAGKPRDLEALAGEAETRLAAERAKRA